MTKQQLQKAKSIIFDTESVRAILDGRKTTARQVIKNASSKWTFDCLSDDAAMTVIDRNGNEKAKELDGLWATFNAPEEYIEFPMIKAKYQAGDILYVRETYFRTYPHQYGKNFYRADGEEIQMPRIHGDTFTYGKAEGLKWTPSIHMPQEAARIFLRVTDVRVERLQDMTEVDCHREGTRANFDGQVFYPEGYVFKQRWNSKTKDLDKYGWEANPYVFVYEFERVEADNA